MSYGTQLFFNHATGCWQDPYGNSYAQRGDGNFYPIQLISPQYFPPPVPHYSAPLHMQAPVAQQSLSEAIPQQPQASRLQAALQPQSIMMMFERNGFYYTFEGIPDTANLTSAGINGTDLNGTGILRCYSDAARKTLSVEISGRIERGQPIIPGMIPKPIPKQYTDAGINAVVETKATEANTADLITRVDVATGERIIYLDAATQTEELPIGFDETPVNHSELKKPTPIKPIIVEQGALPSIVVQSDSIIAPTNTDVKESEPKTEEIAVVPPELARQEAKCAEQQVENPTYGKDRKTITHGTIFVSGLEQESGPAKFTGALAKIKGTTEYKPALQSSGVMQWGDQRKFTGHFDHHGLPTEATDFILGNGYKYSGAVNAKLQLQGEGELKKTDHSDWSLTGKFDQGKLIGNAKISFDKSGAQYVGPVDDQYRPHGEGKLTKRWYGLTLVFQGRFNAGQWQADQPVNIEGLGSFIGQPGDEINPNPGQITFLNKAKAEQVSFGINGIQVTDMTINKGAAQLRYSGYIDTHGYPVGEGMIQVHWDEELSARPNDYSIRGSFSGENITIRKQHYTVTVGDVVHPSTHLKDFWLSEAVDRNERRRGSKSESSSSVADSAVSSAASSLSSSPTSSASQKEAAQCLSSTSSSSILPPPQLSEYTDFNRLLPIAEPIRQKIIGGLAQGQSFPLLAFPVDDQDNSFQLFTEVNEDGFALGECCWRASEASMHPDDYYFIGQVEKYTFPGSASEIVYFPDCGVLFARSGHILAGKFLYEVEYGLPKLMQGCVIWNGGEAFITMSQDQNASANWLKGEKPVTIYEANNKQNREATCRQQLDEIIKALLWHISAKGKRTEFTAQAKNCWHSEASYEGPVTRKQLTAEELNSKESCADLLIPGLDSSVDNAKIMAGDLIFQGAIKNGVAIRGRITQADGGGDTIVFDGVLNLQGLPQKGCYFWRVDNRWHCLDGVFQQTASGIIFTGSQLDYIQKPKNSTFKGQVALKLPHAEQKKSWKNQPIQALGIDFSGLIRVTSYRL